MRHLAIPVSIATTALVGAVLFLGLDPSVPTSEPGGDTDPAEIETSAEDLVDSPAAPEVPPPPVVADGPATLTGVVKDERGAVLADARVTLRRPGTRSTRTVEIVTAESDAKGCQPYSHFAAVRSQPIGSSVSSIPQSPGP